MKKLIYDTYGDICRAAAVVVAEQLEEKPDSIFGLPTGSTPIGLYEELVKLYGEGKIDFSKAKSFNLDEYYPIKQAQPQSYHYFMSGHLFSKVNFASWFIPNGEAVDPAVECAAYDAKIDEAGGIDLQILGIGLNGHIGFNEPSVVYPLRTNLVGLTESTLEANSRFFDKAEDQPSTALTLGFGAIFAAKKILLLISGAAKAEIAKKLFEDNIYTDVPGSLLQLHPNVTVLLDKAAAALLD